MKKYYVLLINTLILVTLIGCQENTTEEVNVYSARKEELTKPLLDEFTKKTGVKVNLITGSADALLQRLKSEGKNSPADVFITVDAGRLHRAFEAGVTQAINSDAINQIVPAEYRDPDGHWFGLSLRARPIMYALDRVDPNELSTYEALAEDQWKGRVCIRSSGNIYNQSLIASMLVAMGSTDLSEWLTGFVQNFARPPVGGDRDQIKALAAGQCDVAIANTYYLFGMLNAKDEQKNVAQKVGVFWPNQSDRGTHVNVSGIALTANAPNKSNAMALIEHLLTEQSQQWYAQVNGEYPVRQGVKIADLLESWGDYKKDAINLSELGKNNAQAVKLMDQAGWK